MITIRYINNAIEKREESEPTQIEWSGQTYADLAKGNEYTSCVCRTGVIRVEDEEWGNLVWKDDILVFVRYPMVTGVGAFILAAGIWLAKAAITGLAVGSITAIVGRLLAPSAQTPSVSKARTSESPAYGFDEVQNDKNPTGPIQIVFGNFRTPGSIISSFRTANKDLWLYVKHLLGEGPIQGIGDYTTDQDLLENDNLPDEVLINGIKAKDLSGFLTMNIRLGNDSQDVAPGFTWTEREYAQDFRLDKGTEGPFTWRTKRIVTGFRIIFAFRGGLFENEDGDMETQRVRIRVQAFRETDDVEVLNEIRTIAQSTRSPFWKDYSSPKLDPGKYRIKATLTEGMNYESDPDEWDAVDIVAINERETVPFQHPRLAYLTYKIKASSKLSGGFPSFHATVNGALCITSIGQIPLANREWSDNPADIVRTLLLDKTFGAGNIVKESHIDESSWNAFKTFCATQVPTFTGSGTTEARFRWDGVIDTARPFWDRIVDICGVCRCIPFRVGNLIKFKLENQKLPSLGLNRSDWEEDSFKSSPIGLRQRRNRIEVAYLDRDSNWVREFESDETRGLSEDLGNVRQTQMDAPGITRATQARRYAAFLLRYERFVGAKSEFTAGPKSLYLEPGDVVSLERGFTDDIIAGKLIGVDGSGFAQMDKSFTYTAGVVYEYTEVNHLNGAVLSYEFTSTGSSDSLPFVPLHGNSRVLGRSYILGPVSVAKKDWYVTRIKTEGRTGYRDFECIEYDPLIYTDAADEKDFEEPPVDPPGLSVPDPVTGLAVTGEGCEEPGINLFTLEWTEPSPDTDLTYEVFWRFKGDDDPSFLGQTDGAIFAFEIDELALGANIEFIVRTLSRADGGFIEMESAPSIDYQITNESDGCDIVTLPGDVTNIQLVDASQPDGNVYTLSWDAVVGADGYEVREGSWAAGTQIYRGTDLSLSVILSQVEKKFYVRAFIDAYFSGAAGEITGDATQYQSYSTPTEAEKVFALEEEGSIQNGSVIDVEQGERWLLQTDRDFLVQFISDTVDAGSSADTHVSVEIRTAQTPTEPVDSLQIFSDSDTWSAFGLIHQKYTSWELVIQHRTGTSGAWTDVAFTDFVNANLTVTGRQFRLKFEATTDQIGSLFDSDDLARRSLVILRRLAIALYR